MFKKLQDLNLNTQKNALFINTKHNYVHVISQSLVSVLLSDFSIFLYIFILKRHEPWIWCNILNLSLSLLLLLKLLLLVLFFIIIIIIINYYYYYYYYFYFQLYLTMANIQSMLKHYVYLIILNVFKVLFKNVY